MLTCCYKQFSIALYSSQCIPIICLTCDLSIKIMCMIAKLRNRAKHEATLACKYRRSFTQQSSLDLGHTLDDLLSTAHQA